MRDVRAPRRPPSAALYGFVLRLPAHSARLLNETLLSLIHDPAIDSGLLAPPFPFLQDHSSSDSNGASRRNNLFCILDIASLTLVQLSTIENR